MSRWEKVRCSAFQVSVNLVITGADSPAVEPRNCPSAGTKSPGGQAVQIEQREDFGDLRGLAAPGRQDRRGEPAAFARLRVGAAIVDPRRDHLDRAGAGEDLAGLVSAVAH